MNPATIQKHAALLQPGTWEAAAAYTNAVCWDERSGYQMIAKDGPDACSNPNQPVQCTRITSKETGRVFDLVSQPGTPQQAQQFVEVQGQVIPNSQHVEPYQPELATAPPSTTPGYPPYPGDQHFDPIGQALFADYAEAKQAPNPGMSRWFGRCDYDYLTGICATNVDAVNKHRPDWRKELGLPPKASSQG